MLRIGLPLKRQPVFLGDSLTGSKQKKRRYDDAESFL